MTFLDPVPARDAVDRVHLDAAGVDERRKCRDQPMPLDFLEVTAGGGEEQHGSAIVTPARGARGARQPLGRPAEDLLLHDGPSSAVSLELGPAPDPADEELGELFDFVRGIECSYLSLYGITGRG